MNEILSSQFIRAAAVRAPLELLLQEEDTLLRRSKREFGRFAKARFAEALMRPDEFMDLFDRARFVAPTTELFLRAGLSTDLSSLGLFGKSGVLSATLWDAIQAVQECLGSFMSWGRVDVQLKRGRCRISFESPLHELDGNTALIQYMAAMLVLLLRQAGSYSGSGLRLYYPSARSAHSSLFPEAVAIRSGPVAIVEFDEALLRSPMMHADPWLNAASKIVLKKTRGKDTAEKDLPHLVSELQMASVDTFGGTISLADMARVLDLPVRTLQAQLSRGNTTFAEIRNGALHHSAKRQLLSGRSIEETSKLLGFQHRQSFSEAFSKWEGQPPSTFASRARYDA